MKKTKINSRTIRRGRHIAWGGGVIGICLTLVVATLAATFAPKTPAHALPFLECGINGYIFRDDPSGNTDVHAVDMVTGDDDFVAEVTNTQLNAMGYNPVDNDLYGWDLKGGKLIKVDNILTNSSLVDLPIPASYTDTKTAVYSGDVDAEGKFWFFTQTGISNNNWYVFDLTTATPTDLTPASHTFSPGPPGNFGADWAYIPGTDNLYRAMDDPSGIVKIYAFSRTTHQWSFVGDTDIPTTDGNMGAVYADPNMNFYMSSNVSGYLFRINLNDTPPFASVKLEDASLHSNDGARCSLATVPTDYGDAPSSYGTLITDQSANGGGARHSVADFNPITNTAPLMLGKTVDLDDNGFPGTGATGDDLNHVGPAVDSPFVDDELGVSHIVANPGSTDPITVPAYVTNTSSNDAVLAGWIDLDRNGTFDSGERVTATIPAGFSGYQPLTFPAPPSPYTDSTYSRFRLFSSTDTSDAATSMSPTGPASSGEIEDVLVQLGSYSVTKDADPPEGSAVDPGAIVSYTLNIQNTSNGALTGIKIDDDLTDILDDATIEGNPVVSPASAGTATVQGTTLEFVGDIAQNQTVHVTYKVKIKEAGTLGNASLNNYVYGIHSITCNPAFTNGQPSVSNPDCSTSHTVNNQLAATGTNVQTPLLIALGLFGTGLGMRMSTRKTA
ncbi:GEVED domain-containing protein [Streptomyces caniscabiei]|uniref:DUF7927 domain-containing protein n=1 Tax=Streptomyces caniscabiei TaxID=2746961 RepID=UPI0029BF4CD2|nr:GEVED domain-containing protein [Streptomyces caniscabiei]MDX2776060.1 GEVED domain-containing protein [Streptomyces caniscabiei]